MCRIVAYLTVLSLLPVVSCDPGGQRSVAAATVPGGVAAIVDAPSETIPTVARRVWGEADPLVAPSPDGRFLSLTDWNTGDLAVRNLETGEIRHVTNNLAPYVPGFAMFSRVSPDGNQIAYAWWTVEGSGAELRIVGWDGGEPRLLRSDSVVVPYAWSADRRYVLVGRKEGSTSPTELGLVATADGSLTVLTALGSWPLRADFSPDGHFVAYDGLSDRYSDDADVFLLETGDRRSRKIVDDASNDILLGWAPDGEHILFSSDRTGTPGVWLLPVKDGRAAEAPALVLPDAWAVQPVGFLDDGRYYYSVTTGGRDIYVATLADDCSSVLVRPELATPRRLGGTSNPAWSPDGRHLAYISRSSPVLFLSTNLVIRSLETGERRHLQLDAGLRPMSISRWTPDGRSLVVVAGDYSGNSDATGIYKVDVGTGQSDALVSERIAYSGVGADLSSDGRVLYYRTEVEGHPILFRKDLGSGAVQEVYRDSGSRGVRYIALSPDGSSLALALTQRDGQAQVAVVAARGGGLRELTPLLPSIRSITWTPDGSSILYSTYVGDPAARRWGVWRVGVAGGEAEPIGLETDGEILGLRFHPDGRRLAFVGGLIGFELWVLENFLPGTR